MKKSVIIFSALLCFALLPVASASALGLHKIGRFDQPVYIEQAGTNLYVVEKAGKVIVRRSGKWKTFMNIKLRVFSEKPEQGLLSIAFSPKWQTDKHFYVYFTNGKEDEVLYEGTSNQSGTKGWLSRRLLFFDDKNLSHNGGLLQFGPDGYLYLGVGDGGGIGDPLRNAQNTYSLFGKILRISPEKSASLPYTIPPDNPFVSGGGRGEIFSYGLRNPWRFSFGDGRIWIADVGQFTWEEINSAPLQLANGGNFGWSAFEGPDPYNTDQGTESGMIKPQFVYGHDQGCSVIGGYLLENTNLPGLENRYVYGDFCSGKVSSLAYQNGTLSGNQETGLVVPLLVSFARGNAGQLWAVSLAGGVFLIRP